jgi:uncharacterized DUF497 family protein
MLRFVFDEAKSTLNEEKHGIDFIEAQVLWEDPDRLEIPAMTKGEPRHAIIGKIGQKEWTAIITYRGDAIRIISVRRAHEKEAKCYNDRGI